MPFPNNISMTVNCYTELISVYVMKYCIPFGVESGDGIPNMSIIKNLMIISNHYFRC